MDSERLAQEDELLRQIRLAISSLGTIRTAGRRRKGAMYASTAITSGIRLYTAMRDLGFTDSADFKKHEPEKFRTLVMQPNLKDGDEFGELLRGYGWPLTVVPGQFWAPGWGQTHYMSFWRTVINLLTKNTCQNTDWCFSTGSAEEFLIALRFNMDGHEHKRMFIRDGSRVFPANPSACADDLRRAIDKIASWGFDPTELYNIWREIVLTIDVTKQMSRTGVNPKTS